MPPVARLQASGRRLAHRARTWMHRERRRPCTCPCPAHRTARAAARCAWRGRSTSPRSSARLTPWPAAAVPPTAAPRPSIAPVARPSTSRSSTPAAVCRVRAEMAGAELLLEPPLDAAALFALLPTARPLKLSARKALRRALSIIGACPSAPALQTTLRRTPNPWPSVAASCARAWCWPWADGQRPCPRWRKHKHKDKPATRAGAVRPPRGLPTTAMPRPWLSWTRWPRAGASTPPG